MLAGRERSENTSENTLKYGVDMMYGIMSNLTLDLTTHTDFAQIEVDEEIINIDRFDVYRPEKRDFFLEGGEVFNFGSGESYAQMFYTRRIGLTPDRKTVPILAGGKLTGKIGDYDVGILMIQISTEIRLMELIFLIKQTRS